MHYIRADIVNPTLYHHETESLLFRSHYRLTSMMLVAFSIIITVKMSLGDPIVCTNTPHVLRQVTESYCWSHSTFSAAKSSNETLGKEVSDPDIDASKDKSDYVYHDYYQYVYLVLYLQGIFFYLPHGVWRTIEGGEMERLYKNILNPPIYSTIEEEDDERRRNFARKGKLFASAVFFHKRLGRYNKYALAYWICEIIAWLNIILQMYFVNSFFHGRFVALGKTAIECFKARQFLNSSLSWEFPRVTTCQFNISGPIGTIETVKVQCLLPINTLTENIYLFLWFWFVFLISLSSLGILLTAVTVACPKIRGLWLSLQLRLEFYSLYRDNQNLVSAIGEITGYGDWFILTVLAHKMDAIDFQKFLFHIREQITLSMERDMNISEVLEATTAL